MSNWEANPQTISLAPVDARKRLESAATLHWFHWLVVLGSLLLTLFAWYYTKSEKEARIKLQFDREADHVIELVQERMKKYEDALWSGVGLLSMADGEVTFDQWKDYAESIRIDKKYPGINGIGVIHSIEQDELSDYLSAQRMLRPDYKIHPEHPGEWKLPISYIVPVEGNEQAVGLDMAHERNRFRAANKAKSTGQSQLTGPITLVQDDGQTPGFLLFTPFYDGGHRESPEDHEKHFSGLVYAPFVVKNLMEGTLGKDQRQVGLRLQDGAETLYDEHMSSEPDFDPNPLFTRTADIELFGRRWTFDIWTARSFRDATSDSHPWTILAGGVLIDLMLLLLFLSISHSSHKAIQMTHQLELASQALKLKAKELERSNKDLEQFASIASHDLQEPLRKVSSFCQLIRDEHGDKLGEEGNQYVNFAIDGANRMRSLVQDLLTFSKIGSKQDSTAKVDAEEAFRLAVADVETSIVEAGATVTAGNLPKVFASKRELCQLFQNLISNSIKYRTEENPKVHVTASRLKNDWKFSVSDNGIGIAPEHRERVFGIFKRLHNRNKFPGTGIGLAICKRIVTGLNGEIWIETSDRPGCTVSFTIPKKS